MGGNIRTRVIALLLVLGLAAAACGSRSSGKASSTTSGPGPTSSGATLTDPQTPCGPGDAKGATGTGVSDTAIKIGTYQDIGGPRQGLFQGNLDAMNAFVAYCDSLGGVNGRKLELDRYDSALSEVRAQVLKACDGDLAIVGEAAALDGPAAQPGVACGIPDVPAFTAEVAHRGAANVVQPLPNPPNGIGVNTERYLAKKYPDKVKHAAMLYVNVAVGPPVAHQRVEGFQKVGWSFVYQQPIDIAELNWGPKIQAFRANNVGVFEIVSDLTNLVNGLKEIHAQGLTGVLALSDQSGYDRQLLQQAGPAAEGTYVEATTVPFEEAKTSNEMQLFLSWLGKVAPGRAPTALGVQSWSAGLLFATALKSLGSNVTRASLTSALHDIHTWDGHGIHTTSNPGSGQPSPCGLTLQVKKGKFVRVFPAHGFSCDPKNIVTASAG